MQTHFKKTLLISALALMGTVSSVAHAEEAAAAAEAAAPVDTLAFNVGVVSEYRYRGISQSRFDPALQGGVDFTSKDGWYVGTWLSSIDWIKDSSTSTIKVKGPVEWDLYGGYRGEIATDLTYDVGYLRYEYAGNTLAKLGTSANANTDEIYGALTYKLFTAKYSYSLDNLFGFEKSQGSGYLDLSVNLDLGDGYSLVPHVGHQSVAKNGSESYTDYSLTLGKDFGNGFSVSAAAIGTDAKTGAYVSPNGKNLGKSSLVVGVKYTF